MYDVTVIGGGLSGVAAATAAAKMDLKVCLVESQGVLGGTATTSYVNPFMKWSVLTNGERKPIIRGVFEEILKRLEEVGGVDPSFPAFFDTELLKVVLLEMVLEYDVDVYFLTTFTESIVKEGKLRAIKTYSKKGYLIFESKVFVDATADADVSVSAGVPYEIGDPQLGYTQPLTLMFKVSGIDFKRFIRFLKEHPEDVFKWVNIDHLEKCVEQGKPFSFAGLQMLVKKAKERGDFPEITLIDYIAPLACFPQRGEAVFNNTRIQLVNGTDPLEVARATLEGYKQALQILKFLRKYVPGFEKSFLSQIPPKIGIRETRRIIGEYILKYEDIVNLVEFPDKIARACYGIDVHPVTPNGKGGMFYEIPPGKSYTIPLRSLIPLKIDNLLVAGRCISADHYAQGAIRVMPTVTAIGHAAGVAAGVSVLEEVVPRQVDYRVVQRELLKQNAVL